MPFGPLPWADEVRDVAAAACAEGLGDGRPLIYRRGDDAAEGRILRSIWDELCRAHVVLVDLSKVNVNVAIELGMAHTLGKRLLAVRVEGDHPVPRHVEKLRVLPYRSVSDRDDPRGLWRILRERRPSS
jgi:hypothetical protein